MVRIGRRSVKRGKPTLEIKAPRSGSPFLFFDSSDAEDAVHDLDGKDCMGERLRVELARSRDMGRRDDRRDRGRYDRGGRYGDRDRDRRRGNPPGPRTKYRLIVDNLASRTSWQVRTLFPSTHFIISLNIFYHLHFTIYSVLFF